jgi:antitoxin YefM
MTTITSAQADKSLIQANLKVCDDREPLVIVHDEAHSVVMLPLEEYEALNETRYLMRNPANASHLLESIAELRAGKGVVHELDLDA